MRRSIGFVMHWNGQSRRSKQKRGPTLNRLLIIGAGGHAKVVIDVARAAGWLPIGAIDRETNDSVLDVPVIGDDSSVRELWRENMFDAVTVAIGENTLRQKLSNMARSYGCPTPALIHPCAYVSRYAQIAEGTVVMPSAVVNAAAQIGRDCIVNTGSVVEHDCELKNAVHVAPRSAMGGSCYLGSCALFGIGATARPGVRIGDNVVVGAGATVVSNVPNGWLVYGTPARRAMAG